MKTHLTQISLHAQVWKENGKWDCSCKGFSQDVIKSFYDGYYEKNIQESLILKEIYEKRK